MMVYGGVLMKRRTPVVRHRGRVNPIQVRSDDSTQWLTYVGAAVAVGVVAGIALNAYSYAVNPGQFHTQLP